MRIARLGALLAIAAPAFALAAEDVPEWVFPGGGTPAASQTLPGGAGDGPACGFCHLPTGQGRPENAALAGLPRDAIIAQVRAFADGSRGSARPDFAPYVAMQRTAHTVSDADLAQAADYFAGLPRRAFGRVVEADTIPRVIEASYTHARAPGGGTEPLGQRIIEMPDDFARFERRDPTVTYTAFVPVGAIARGAELVQSWGEFGGFACAACHGADYGGAGVVPPLAGRSPIGIVRQLVNFRSGARHGGNAELMRQVAADMGTGDMIALAAWLGAQPVPSRPPATP